MMEVGNGIDMAEFPEQKLELVEFQEYNPDSTISLEESKDFWDRVFSSEYSVNSFMERRAEQASLVPRSGGKWSGEPGNSKWEPDAETTPGDRHGTNPGQKTWKEIMKEYGFDSITFKDGYPDFSGISKAEVEIDDFTDDRDSNFAQADEKLAEQRGCTPEEVAKWREEHKYTWHECEDCKTMQKVPTEVHGNIPHSGGISEQKSKEATA